MRKGPQLLAVVLVSLVTGCSSSTGQKPAPATASRSSAATPSATPVAAAEPAVALVDWDGTGTSYNLSLVSSAAKVLASAHATWTRGARCGAVQAGIIEPPPVSTSNDRAYYLDGDAIKWLAEDGRTGVAFQGLAANAVKAYGFAVAPDDSVFALNTIDYSPSPITQQITITRVGASSLGTVIYSAPSTGTAAVWPTGWRNGDLVLAYHRGTCTQGGGPGLADAASYHVVNAQTADRKATIGSDAGASCGLVGTATPAGIPCGGYLGIADKGQTQVLDWSGAMHSTYGAWFLPGGLSPNGLAYLGNTMSGNQSRLTLIRAAGDAPTVPVGDCFACPVMWIDDSNFVVTGGTGSSVQVFAANPEPLQGKPVTASGFPVARIPGSLGGA